MRSGLRLVLIGLAVAVGCGDPDTNDDRGYTKAPLENPRPFIQGEEPDAMRQHAAPNLPRAVILEDTVTADQ